MRVVLHACTYTHINTTHRREERPFPPARFASTFLIFSCFYCRYRWGRRIRKLYAYLYMWEEFVCWASRRRRWTSCMHAAGKVVHWCVSIAANENNLAFTIPACGAFFGGLYVCYAAVLCVLITCTGINSVGNYYLALNSTLVRKVCSKCLWC